MTLRWLLNDETEERANEEKDKLNKEEKEFYGEHGVIPGIYYDSYRVLQWEVKE